MKHHSELCVQHIFTYFLFADTQKLGEGKGLHDCNGDILPRQTMEKYDLIVVGSGPGGQRAAIQASKFGKRAALIEKLEVIGGTAINTGTIPSKTIREAVLRSEERRVGKECRSRWSPYH